MESKKAIHVVCVSPSDVADERDAFDDAIKMANQVVSTLDVIFVPHRWEEVSPGYHPEGPQALIDSRLNIEQCDLLIGIFWKRFGIVDTPPYSRTASEIVRAVEARKLNLTRPEIKIYFCNRYYYPASVKELEEHTLVLKFKQQLADTVLYEEYDDVAEFRIVLFRDLIEYLVRAKFIDEPADPQLSLQVTSNPILLRLEGLTELTPDLRLSLARKVPFSWIGDLIHLDINVFPTSFVGNQSDEDGFSDIVLFTGGEDETPLARARIGEQYSNGISFAEVGITAKDSIIHQDLWIRGIRSGIMPLAGHPLLAQVAVTLTRRGKGGEHTSILGPQTVMLGFPVRSTQFSAKLASDEVKWSAEGEGPQVVSVFTVHFREAFPGAFKCREEESGQTAGTAAHGDILKVSGENIPKHFDVFVTTRDLPVRGSGSPVQQSRAIAKQIDFSGRPLNRDCEASPLVWNSEWFYWESQTKQVQMNTQIRLTRIDRTGYGVNLAHHFEAGWELVSKASLHQDRELVFGVVITGPDNEPLKQILLRGMLGPQSSRASPLVRARSLAVPCFDNSCDLVELLLEKPSLR